jgi:hypothetical protein
MTEHGSDFTFRFIFCAAERTLALLFVLRLAIKFLYRLGSVCYNEARIRPTSSSLCSEDTGKRFIITLNPLTR